MLPAMRKHEPTDPMQCPECDSAELHAQPHPDMDEAMAGPATSVVVPAQCEDCATLFELIYEFDKIGY